MSVREAIVGVTKENYDNLTTQLEHATLKDNGNVLVLTDSKDGVSSYIGYENFRIFCERLLKYLEI